MIYLLFLKRAEWESRFIMLNSIVIESPSKEDNNVDKRLSADKNDRLVRRMSKYRDHQSDCELKNELGFRDLCLQESDLIKKLQQQKPTEDKKRSHKTQTRKRKVRSEFVAFDRQIIAFSRRSRLHRNQHRNHKMISQISITTKC